MVGRAPSVKASLIAAIAALVISALSLLVWRSGSFRDTESLARNLHLRSVYLATEVTGNLAQARIATMNPTDRVLSPSAYLALAENDYEELRTLSGRHGDQRWRYLLDRLDRQLHLVGDAMSRGLDIAATADAATVTAEQLKRAHRIEYEDLHDQLTAASRTDRQILLTFAVLILLGTALAINWLINRLVATDRARLDVIADLERKNEELTRFSYAVSHDLKSPLITISGFAGLLDGDLAEGNLDNARGDARRIQGAIRRMQDLLDDLLELSLAGKAVQDREPVDLTELASQVVAVVRDGGSANGVHFDIDDKLPTVRVDRERLFDTLRNLVENALKFMGDQTDPHVRIGQRQTPDGPVYFVSDNGSGIDPADLERVFELFERLGTGEGGSGIGLALARRIIEAHGGRIWAESAGRGQGSTFHFTLGA